MLFIASAVLMAKPSFFTVVIPTYEEHDNIVLISKLVVDTFEKLYVIENFFPLSYIDNENMRYLLLMIVQTNILQRAYDFYKKSMVQKKLYVI